jgi:hypothetical protein
MHFNEHLIVDILRLYSNCWRRELVSMLKVDSMAVLSRLLLQEDMQKSIANE